MKMKLNSREKKLMDDLAIGTDKETVKNPYSGESVELEPEAVALYDAIKGAEMLGDHQTVRLGQGIFIKNWADAYMVLLD